MIKLGECHFKLFIKMSRRGVGKKIHAMSDRNGHDLLCITVAAAYAPCQSPNLQSR